MIKKRIQFNIALIVLSVLTIVGITACSDSFNTNQSSVTITLPGATGRKAMDVDKETLAYTLKLEGIITYEATAKSGETVTFDKIEYGEYTLLIDAYSPEQILYYSSKTSVTVESKETEVTAVLKYVGPQLTDDLEITVKIDDEVQDIEFSGETEIKTEKDKPVVIEAPEGYEEYIWFLWGEVIGEERVLKFDPAELKLEDGKYLITLMVYGKDNVVYSKDIYLVIGSDAQ